MISKDKETHLFTVVLNVDQGLGSGGNRVAPISRGPNSHLGCAQRKRKNNNEKENLNKTELLQVLGI